MQRIIMAAAVVLALLASGQPARAQDLGLEIVGSWKLTSFSRKELATGSTVRPFGERPAGHLIYTKGGTGAYVITAEKRPTPGANPTEAERLELYRTITAASGRYRVEANGKLVFIPEASTSQATVGREQAYHIQVAGRTLIATSAPIKSPMDGQEVVIVSTWERLE
jgi:hypothetical protein